MTNIYKSEEHRIRMRIRISLLIFLILLVLPTIYAEQQSLGTFKTGMCLQLTQTCSNCTYVNISSISYPNSSQAVGQVEMTATGTFYNYTFCDTFVNGNYIVQGFGDLDGSDTVWIYDFTINPIGQSPSTAQSITYLFIFGFSILIFFGLLFVGVTAPYKNKTDEMSGYVLAVSNVKYIKLTCLGFAWIFAVFISYFAWMLSYAYLDMEFLSDILRFIFNFLAIATLPLFILFTYLTIANLVRDSQIGEALMRGLDVK